MEGYLGIDESNHGGNPEIIVAVHSVFPEDQKIAEEFLSKKRKQIDLENIIGERDFRYISISASLKKDYMLTDRDIKAIAYSEMIKYYSGVSGVFIDGHIEKKTISRVKASVFPEKCPNIINGAKLDIKCPIVNIADSIANILVRYFRTIRDTKNNGKYSCFEIKPNISQYAKCH